jgi:hypothetical protein
MLPDLACLMSRWMDGRHDMKEGEDRRGSNMMDASR